MEFLKCRDVRWKGPKKRDKPDVAATTAKHPDERIVVGFHATAGGNRRACAVSHFGGNLLPAAVLAPAVAICLKSLLMMLKLPNNSLDNFSRAMSFSSVNLFLCCHGSQHWGKCGVDVKGLHGECWKDFKFWIFFLLKKMVWTQEWHTLIEKDHLGDWSPETDVSTTCTEAIFAMKWQFSQLKIQKP